MSHTIKHLYHIAASNDAVWKAITSIEGINAWWAVGTTGAAEPGQDFQMHFGPNGGPEFRVGGNTAEGSITWECTASPFPWVGHVIRFQLDTNDGKTRVRFSHEGFESQDDTYASTNFSWARYLESLRQYVQTGIGEGHGNPGYRK